jgi:pimeloyl-ACP methyl ester carboxylesterase
VNLFPALLLSVASFGESAEQAVVTDLMYASPARLIDIGHGRKMNILCVGHGSPTVIFDAGLGDQVREWATVQPAIGKTTRACSYDRAGLGFSSPSSREGTSENAVDDLHRLLRAAVIKPPYVLVGHSLGGMYLRLYADKYFSEVSGMVLVDPVSEEQGGRYYALDPPSKVRDDAFVQGLHECITAASKGFVCGSELSKKCVGEPDKHFSAAFNTAVLAAFARVERQRAVWSEWVNVFQLSSDQVRAAKRSYGALPLIVLTRAPSAKGSQETAEMRQAKNVLWMELHDDLARLSTKGINRVVPNAGHYIQFDRPDVVIDAVREVVSAAAN